MEAGGARGGTCDPLIVSWPAGIPADQHGTVRRQYCHAVDVLPTLLDCIGVDAPARLRDAEQLPIAGTSLRATFPDPAPDECRTTQSAVR